MYSSPGADIYFARISANFVEDIPEATLDLSEKRSQSNLRKRAQSTDEIPGNTPSLVGLKLSRIFADAEQLKDKGKIQPAEICAADDPENSQWVYSCCHTDPNLENDNIVVIYLQDCTDIKNEYNSVSRNILTLEGLRKMISPAIPDFILDSEYIVGNPLTLKIDADSKIAGMYPFIQEFLGSDRGQIFNLPIMQFIHQGDQLVLAQGLSECLKTGICNLVLRWNPYSVYSAKEKKKVSWVHGKAVRAQGKKNEILLTVSNLVSKNEQQILDQPTNQVWSYLMGKSTGLPTLPSLFSSGKAAESSPKKINSSNVIE